MPLPVVGTDPRGTAVPPDGAPSRGRLKRGAVPLESAKRVPGSDERTRPAVYSAYEDEPLDDRYESLPAPCTARPTATPPPPVAAARPPPSIDRTPDGPPPLLANGDPPPLLLLDTDPPPLDMLLEPPPFDPPLETDPPPPLDPPLETNPPPVPAPPPLPLAGLFRGPSCADTGTASRNTGTSASNAPRATPVGVFDN